MSIGLLGQKIGMTSVYDANGRLCSVTVIAAGDNVLLRRLTEENEGYSAVQVGFGAQKESRVTKGLLGEFKKAGVGPQRFVREFRLQNDLPEGEIDLSVSQFQPGDFVDVIGRSKGKGFQGVMKKHNFAGQGAAHGSKMHRRIGAVGNRSTPGRIWKNQGMPGHMGDRRVTVQNLQVMQVRETEKTILVSGAVPGANGSYVIVRPAIKHPERVLALHAEHRKHEEEEKAKKPKTLREMAQRK
jgi:large subunit ribosomal protein L3